MKNRVIWAAALVLCFFSPVSADIASLSHLFLLGKGLLDLDQDGFGDRIAYRVIVPDDASAVELALAAEIAARANFESLSQEMDLVSKVSSAGSRTDGVSRILVGSKKSLARELALIPSLPALGPRQGAVVLLGDGEAGDIAVTAGSEEALLKAGRGFFLRWPYLWEVWGREDGITYFTVEEDLGRFLEASAATTSRVVIRAAFYEFPEFASPEEAVRRLRFDSGEIKDLWLELHFSDRNNKGKTEAALTELARQHRRGERTGTLSYPGCGQITFILREGGRESRLIVPRVGYPKRMLTPGYKEPHRRNAPEKDFDLLSAFSAKGLHSDGDQDGLLDGLDSQVILPRSLRLEALAPLASRLVLQTTGASFPIALFEDEIEDIKAVTAPILLADGRFTQELIKTGKFKTPALQPGWAAAQVVPRAFNKSNGLALFGADLPGLEKMVRYLSLDFPYLDAPAEGAPQLSDLAADLQKFLQGERGSAEAYLQRKIASLAAELKERELEFFRASLYLPEENSAFVTALGDELKKTLRTSRLEVEGTSLKKNKVLFEKQKDLRWEADEALSMLQEKIEKAGLSGKEPLKISLGISESVAVRKSVKARVEEDLRKRKIENFEVEVASSYKPGFFWLTEKILPALRGRPVDRLTILFAEEKDDLTAPKRFYAEPTRWLQELYPVDEILARELGIPLAKIGFEKKDGATPIYEGLAWDKSGELLLRESFTPRTRDIRYLAPLPEWGKVKVTTGWIRAQSGQKIVLDQLLASDLERFWEYFQAEALVPLYAQIMKKTENDPTTSKQPYFKKLQVELWLSEPDYRLGLDEEMVSSLEAMHDEIYFDTLDLLRGITRVEVEDQDVPEDTSRFSAPGNIFPLVHPSVEGAKGRVKIVLEDWQAASPQAVLAWKFKGREEEHGKTLAFPALRPKTIRWPQLIFNGREDRLENLSATLEFEKEADYLGLLEILQNLLELQKKGLLRPSFSYPRLNSLTLEVNCRDLEKKEVLAVAVKEKTGGGKILASAPASPAVTDQVISPEKCLEIVRGLARHPGVKSYVAGLSYESRQIPVLEIFWPQGPHVSLPRLLAAKPTLFLSGRQHANEVSSTNYLLKFAELLATDPRYRDYTKKMNFVMQPMENPDGAALAYELQKLTPFHSLHAGRYGALGVEIGYQTGVSRPFLPEAAVRKNLQDRWLPDIYLNLHGYPSHEWVQAFSGYVPYLFRDYWVPKGWFAYYRAPRLRVYDKWREAGEALRKMIVEEMQKDAELKASNERFYDRFRRWAARWQPHVSELELHDGLNVYAARRGSQETRLTPRTQITYVEETPELMDETARGDWLEFLCRQGLTYLRAHAEYLSRARFERSRVEEEVQDRIRFQFIRGRPAGSETAKSP